MSFNPITVGTEYLIRAIIVSQNFHIKYWATMRFFIYLPISVYMVNL